MPENFRLSVFKRQSYDLTQASFSGADFTNPVGQTLTTEVISSNGTRSSSEQQLLADARSPELTKTGSEIQMKQNPQRDFWLCTGILFILMLLFVGGILAIHFGTLSKYHSAPVVGNSTNNTVAN